MNATSVAFDRMLHQRLPNPLAHAYRKAYNSPTGKELHDNASHFGLCLLRFLATLGLAFIRDFQIALNREETELLAKTDRPSEGDWHRWLLRAVQRIRERKLPANDLGSQLDAYLHDKRETSRSELPGTLGQLLTHLDKKPVVRKDATAIDFLLTLIRYRNDTIGHGAVLAAEVNQAHGEAILRAAAELAATLPFAEGWELKYMFQSLLGPTAVECQLVHLMGPDWLREAPVSYPRGYPAPLTAHVVLMPPTGGRRHLDLHPLVAFHNGQVLFFNGLRGKTPTYLEYDSGHKQAIEALTADYQEWKQHLGVGTEAPAESGEVSLRPPPSSEQRFRFDRLLGRGGMGEVWLAYDEMLKRPVAIKRVRRELLGRADVDRRFLQEARDAARLSHPNIVPILSIDSDDQGPYLVLEYMEGGSLRQPLAKGHLQLPVALAYLRQMLQALQHAHEQGLIHRDVKPENILLSKAGAPKLADFGLAWFLEEEEETRAEGAREGTRAYMAPEIRGGHDSPSARTDLYSLGLTFYEMLTARTPLRIEEKAVPSPALPLLRKLVHADPNLRYDSAQAALADCLELERALELAGRTEEETQGRIRQTAEQAFQLLADGRPIDAQAGFERILAEAPDNDQGLTGMLLLHLTVGDMEQASARYRALAARNAAEPRFLRYRQFIESIQPPVVLRLTPQALPFSYRIEELRRGQFVKELIEQSPDTINLGDTGEILVEMAQKSPERRANHENPAPDHHRLGFELERARVVADFRYLIQPKSFFRAARLLASDVTLTITADAFDVYRLVRFLTANLVRRFKRSATDWVRPEAAEQFGYDIGAAREQWQRLHCDINRDLLLR